LISNLRRNLALALTVALLISFGCSRTHSANAQSVKSAKDRKAAPDFDLKDVNGKIVHLSDFRGKAVLLDFWATWCGPCKIEIPWFVDMQRKYKDRGLVVIGIAMDDEGWKAVKPFLDEMKVNYRVVMGNDQTADLYGGVEALPTTFVLDREGRIAKTHVGLSSKEDFEDEIEKILADPQQQTRAAVVPGGGALRAK
jgi:cytochrome c biogenesis protein CcmG/thiol:disulfide interchange protein DsbE